MTVARDDGGSEVVRLPQRIPFTMVDNPIIRAMTDYVALGLYVDMLSYPTGWRINIRELAKSHKQGRQVLTDAMNDLIGRGLVFRLRYQEPTGRWRTRTYVCSSPVTLTELRDIQTQYSRCMIETSGELTQALNSRPPSVKDDLTGLRASTPFDPGSDHAPVAADPASALVTPSTRFPAPGRPGSGEPDAGPPDSSNVAPQRLESTRKIPPPPPNHRSRAAGRTREEERELTHESTATGGTEAPTPAHPDLNYVMDAVVQAWPMLGCRDLNQLRPLVGEALAHLPTAQAVEHLVNNTGGARHPLALLRSRLNNLPPPRQHKRVAEWCGECTSRTYRWMQDADGNPIGPCPRCSPQARGRSGHTSSIDEERPA